MLKNLAWLSLVLRYDNLTEARRAQSGTAVALIQVWQLGTTSVTIVLIGCKALLTRYDVLRSYSKNFVPMVISAIVDAIYFISFWPYVIFFYKL